MTGLSGIDTVVYSFIYSLFIFFFLNKEEKQEKRGEGGGGGGGVRERRGTKHKRVLRKHKQQQSYILALTRLSVWQFFFSFNDCSSPQKAEGHGLATSPSEYGIK